MGKILEELKEFELFENLGTAFSHEHSFKIYKSDLREGTYRSFRIKFGKFTEKYLIKNNLKHVKIYANKKTGKLAFVFTEKEDDGTYKLQITKTGDSRVTLSSIELTKKLLEFLQENSVDKSRAPYLLRGGNEIVENDRHLIMFS